MPRSGTTLCEQILASHSDVHGADELTDIPIAAARLDTANYRGRGSVSKGPLRIDPQALRDEGARYLRQLMRHSFGRQFTTPPVPTGSVPL